MVLQAQVLAVMGQTREAEKMTTHIVEEDKECLECYRLLSAIYSKQERHAQVGKSLLAGMTSMTFLLRSVSTSFVIAPQPVCSQVYTNVLHCFSSSFLTPEGSPENF